MIIITNFYSPVSNTRCHSFFTWNAANMAVMCLLTFLIILAFNTNYTVNIKTNTSENIQFNKLFTGNITDASRFGETSNLNISFSLLFSKSRSLMVFVGRDPPLSPDHSVRRRQPLAAEFHCLFHFSGTLIETDSGIHPVRALFRPAPYLFRTKLASFATLLQPPFHCHRRIQANLFTLLLLIIGGVEVNPGPTSNFSSWCVEHTVYCQQGSITSQPNG